RAQRHLLLGPGHAPRRRCLSRRGPVRPQEAAPRPQMEVALVQTTLRSFASLAALLVLVLPAAAQDLQEYAEGETPEYSETIVPKLNALVLVASPDAVVPEGLFE